MKSDELKEEDAKPSGWSEGKKKVASLKTALQESIQDDSNSQTYAVLSYIPVLGPLVVFLFKRGQKFSRLHAQNAAYLQIAFFSIWLVIWLAENLPIVSRFLKIFQFVPFITNALMYLNVITLLLASAYGAWQASRAKSWVVPYLYKFMDEKIFKRVVAASKKKASQ